MENIHPIQSSQIRPLKRIALIVIVLVLGAVGFVILQNNSNSNNSKSDQTESPQPSKTTGALLSPHTLVYGSWIGSNSEITAVDLSTRKSSTIANLPASIKKVGIINSSTIIYIDETGNRDHGKQIKLYDIKTKKENAKISADSNFGIDDYVLSPNKRYAAVWEVSFAEGSEVLLGGRSRIYGINLSNPSVKKLLYDEVASPTNPVHYPRAVLDNGKVFTDKFMPNDPSGNGWAYGMSVINFDGSGNQDLTQMQNGSYGTQPYLSPDGKLLVFAGYDGSSGPGTDIKDGFRQAILKSNTIETLDTTTLTRKKLSNLSNSNVYTMAEWDNTSNNILTALIGKGDSPSGFFTYNLLTNSLKEVSLPTVNADSYTFISTLSKSKSLLATILDTPSDTGNLGDTYASTINKFYIFDKDTNQISSLQLETGFAQYITLLPANYFQNVLGIAHAQGANPSAPNIIIVDSFSDKPAQKNLQLKTFQLKPALAPIRETQQALPICIDLGLKQCAEQNSTDPRCSKTIVNKTKPCYDSPLYLYGATGNKVGVKVHTTVYNDVPVYSDGYDVTLLDGGKMQINEQVYSAINYDYRSNLRILKTPKTGIVTARSGVEKVLQEYARRLGLNEKETTDLVKVGETKATTPYVFISFFDHALSNQILPLSFTPKPDNYLNVVFYFKLLNEKPNFTPLPPVFGKPLKRTGFTAVEVSEIVE